MLMKSAFGLTSPAGPHARLSVLIFHRVTRDPDPMFPDEMHATRFAALCGWLAAWFNVLPLTEAVVRLRTGTLPARSISITFDDGYADNHDVALPILKQHGLTATFFIATGFLDGGRMWNDSLIEVIRATALAKLDLVDFDLGAYALDSWPARRKAAEDLLSRVKYLPVAERVEVGTRIADLGGIKLPRGLMMTSTQVANLHRAGMTIGGHTVSHPILAKLEPEAARIEIEDSRDCLERLTGDRIGLFAYPNGRPGEDYSSANVELVRSLGFDAAVTTAWGTTRRGDDLMQIRRFTPWDSSRLPFGLRLLRNIWGR